MMELVLWSYILLVFFGEWPIYVVACRYSYLLLRSRLFRQYTNIASDDAKLV